MDQDSGLAQYLEQLTAGIGDQNLELPGFPEVVNRLQVLLADDNVSMKDIATLISSDPVLTAKLLRTANAAAFNTRGIEIGNLNVALARLGATLVRSISMAFAINQAEHETYLGPIKSDLKEIWRRSNYVAAISCVIARNVPEIPADHAVLAGLVHQIGNLYILVNVQRNNPALMQTLDYHEAVAERSGPISSAVLTAWKFPQEICEAVSAQDQLLNSPSEDMSPLALLVAAAKLRDQLENDPLLREQHPEVDDVLGSVCLGDQSFLDLMAASRAEILDMQDALN